MSSELATLLKGKEFLSTLAKYYVADLELRQMIYGIRVLNALE